jgi:RHH-type proline utilization regulon transcriptional repressor/proline dehydrogenase/delta 1-pyrroline-5-carboxylate dehydrogenase
VNKASEPDVETAIQGAVDGMRKWEETPVSDRAAIQERAADLFQQEMPALIAMLNKEAGKCIMDSLSEVRETIDYCRYYAYRARLDLVTQTLPGPTGELNQLSLHPRGVIACISPWNFPLAIFTGQIVAALVTGNPVIAKPAEQTPLIAFKAIQILHQAGIPKDVLQLLIGPGRIIGAKLVSDPRIAGVMFTGSTATAKFIEQSLANRKGPIALFIAETGGQNAMIVDSSALAEQTVMDIAHSAFNSAGQRCSALRVLFVQEEMAPKLLEMLKGCMAQLTLGDPDLISTDIGPVIDSAAQQMLQNHFAKMSEEATLIAQVTADKTPTGYYFAPSVFELSDLSILEGEVFGPILHVIRYKANELDKVMDAIIKTGYGLTLGIHSRIDATIQYIINRMPVGNIYVNRNMIGAVVGVQPFGGERLSGTGPKAGGPHYLPRLCMERSISNNTTAVGGNARLVSLLEED